MSSPYDATVIEAAGGIVERHTAAGCRIAVICRTRYGVEWALPNGKRKAGETWQQVALREVEEETGLRPVIIGIAGATAYLAGGAPKLVLYWHMRVDDDVPPFTPNDEVTQLAWLSPRDAVRRLSHAEEAGVVRAVYEEVR